MAHILLHTDHHPTTEHGYVFRDATQCEKRQRDGYEDECSTKTLHGDVRVGVWAREVVSYNGGLSIVGVCAA